MLSSSMESFNITFLPESAVVILVGVLANDIGFATVCRVAERAQLSLPPPPSPDQSKHSLP